MEFFNGTHHSDLQPLFLEFPFARRKGACGRFFTLPGKDGNSPRMPLEMEHDSGGSTRLVLGLAPEARQQIVELDQPDGNEGNHFNVDPRAQRGGKCVVGSQTDARDGLNGEGNAARLVRCTNQEVRAWRNGTGKRDLRSKEIGIQVEISAVRRSVVTAEIRDNAKYFGGLEGCGSFPAARIYMRGGEKPANSWRAHRNGAGARRRYDYRAADRGGV